MKAPHNKSWIAQAIALAFTTTSFAAMADDDEKLRESMEKIIVVGEKTDRTLKDTASSVSVVDQSLIDSGQLSSLSDALTEISNVVVLTGAAPDIRGVSGNGSASGFNSFSGGAKARVTTLIDGVAQPFVADLTGDTGLWDVQQVEVYRGPQSTNNGRNSIAGGVYIQTKKPTFDWEGAVRVGYKNEDGYLDTAAVISGPLIENQLAFRLSTQFIDGNTYSNPPVYDTNPTDKDLNRLDTQNTRVQALYTPEQIDNLAINVSYSNYEEKGNAGRLFFLGDDPFDYVSLFQRIMDTQSDTTALTVDYRVSDDISIDFLVSYMDYQWGFESYEANAEAESDVQMNEQDWSVDTKVNFGLSSKRYSGFVGLAYFNRSQDFNSVGATVYEGKDSSTSKAVYGELTTQFATDWSLTSGLRIEREEQLRDFEMVQGSGLLEATLDNAKTFALPKLVLQYDITDNTRLSASARRGYNAGGGAISFTTNEYYYYDSESVNTYEIGSRSVLNGGDINVSANVFYNNFNGYQASNSSRMIQNIDDAHSYGLELEANSMLGDDWQVHASLGLLKTKIDSAGEGYESVIGNELNSAPSTTASLGVTHWLNDEFKVSLSSNYVGEYYGDMNNTEERIAGDYVLTRFSVAYHSENWLVTGFVNNAFDEEGYTTKEPASGRYPVGYAAVVNPQTLGASVTYNF